MRFSCALAALALPFVVASAHADDAPSEAVRARGDMDVALATMRGRAKGVQERLHLARRRGRAAEIACLDEALSRADVAVRRAREEENAALDAYARGDVPRARLGRTHVFALANAQSFVARDALACGTSQADAAGTRVTFDVDPRIPRVE